MLSGLDLKGRKHFYRGEKGKNPNPNPDKQPSAGFSSLAVENNHLAFMKGGGEKGNKLRAGRK